MSYIGLHVSIYDSGMNHDLLSYKVRDILTQELNRDRTSDVPEIEVHVEVEEYSGEEEEHIGDPNDKKPRHTQQG